MTVGTLAVNIVARTDKLVSGLRKGSSTLVKFGKKVTAVAAGLATFGAAAVAAGTAISVYLVKQQFKAVDAIAKFADRIGISTEKLSAFELAAEETGAGVATLRTGLEKMVLRVSEAAQGTGEAVGALKELRLSASRLNRMSPDEQFEAIAGAMSKVRLQSDRARLSYELFGRSGTALVNTLKLGKDGLAEVERFARLAGLTVNREMAAGIERANDAFARLKSLVVGLARQLAIRVAPIMERVSKSITSFFTDGDKIRSFADFIMRGVGRVLAMVIGAVHAIRKAINKLQRSFTELAINVGNSPLGKQFGMGLTESQTMSLIKHRATLMQSSFDLANSDPAGDFLRWFNNHLDKALESDADKKPSWLKKMTDKLGRRFGSGFTSIAERAAKGILPITGALEDLDKAAKGAIANRIINQLTMGFFGKGGPAPAFAGVTATPSLSLAQTGSAESYRQRRRIERQADSMPKIANQQLKVQKEMRDGIKKMANAPAMMPANL